MRHGRRASACGSRLTLAVPQVASRKQDALRSHCYGSKSSVSLGLVPRFVSAVARSQHRSLVAFVPLRSTATLARSQRVRPWAIGRTRETARSSKRLTTLRVARHRGLSRKSAHSHFAHSPFGSLLRSLVRIVGSSSGGQVFLGRPDDARCHDAPRRLKTRFPLRSLSRLRLDETLACATRSSKSSTGRFRHSLFDGTSHCFRCDCFLASRAQSHGDGELCFAKQALRVPLNARFLPRSLRRLTRLRSISYFVRYSNRRGTSFGVCSDAYGTSLR